MGKLATRSISVVLDVEALKEVEEIAQDLGIDIGLVFCAAWFGMYESPVTHLYDAILNRYKNETTQNNDNE